jgi:hypothetical protein
MSAYTKTERWGDIRAKAIAEDDGRCRLCNSTENLRAHHRVYDEDSEEGCHDPENLTVMCSQCHLWYHYSQQHGKLDKGNKIAKFKGKKAKVKKPKETVAVEPEVEEEDDTFPLGHQYRLDCLINEHIDMATVTRKQYKDTVAAFKKMILMKVL